MNIFEQISDVLYHKQDKLCDDEENEKEFQPFLFQKWLSFHSPYFARLMNSSSNHLWKIFENDKKMWYHFFTGVVPKTPLSKKIQYIAKTKKKPKANQLTREQFLQLSENVELSVRELKMYVDSGYVDAKLLSKQFET